MRRSLLSTAKSLRTLWVGLFAAFLLLGTVQIQAEQQLAANAGFGGTGFIVDDPSAGFGGTGRASSGFGGTGVIGTITEFGSIWVNGIEIGYGDLTQISSDLKIQDTLKLGQQVILETMKNDHKALTKQIHIYYPVAGKITSVAQDRLVINYEHAIKFNSQTLVDESLQLKEGRFIAVNGYQTEQGDWQATRLNKNLEHKTFYHPVPTKHFSNEIKKVVIESSVKQLSKWQALSSKMIDTSNLSEQRVVIRGSWSNGQMVPNKLSSYSEVTVHSMTTPTNTTHSDSTIKSWQPLQDQKEQMEMMQLQREQNAIMQDQVEQIQQMQDLQELKGQVDQMQNMRGPLSN
ncbi:MAG: DUF5666 domain-containing protein [Pseudomonadota bacterium]|nr:DUF5666 domain-containing protein [Pseudomonadota bacterium]